MKTILIVSALLLTGCGSYEHSVVNKGDQMLSAVAVKSGKYEFGHGYLPPDEVKGYFGAMRIVQAPPPEISWRIGENGEDFRETVSLSSDPGRRFKVVFEIDGKHATARLEPRSR